MSEFGGLRKHEETQHALKSDIIVRLLTVATIRKKGGQGKLEKSGKIIKRFPVTRKSGNIDYSPTDRESQGI